MVEVLEPACVEALRAAEPLTMADTIMSLSVLWLDFAFMIRSFH